MLTCYIICVTHSHTLLPRCCWSWQKWSAAAGVATATRKETERERRHFLLRVWKPPIKTQLGLNKPLRPSQCLCHPWSRSAGEDKDDDRHRVICQCLLDYNVRHRGCQYSSLRFTLKYCAATARRGWVRAKQIQMSRSSHCVLTPQKTDYISDMSTMSVHAFVVQEKQWRQEKRLTVMLVIIKANSISE